MNISRSAASFSPLSRSMFSTRNCGMGARTREGAAWAALCPREWVAARALNSLEGSRGSRPTEAETQS